MNKIYPRVPLWFMTAWRETKIILVQKRRVPTYVQYIQGNMDTVISRSVVPTLLGLDGRAQSQPMPHTSEKN